jgi:hypothetical protein
MGYASKAGRASTSSTNPRAHAICDRCGFRYNFGDLQWQFDYRGTALQNLRILVCSDCADTPQNQLRAIIVPADPTPIINARPQDFVDAETDYRTISAPTVTDPITGIPIPGTTTRVTQDGSNRTLQPIGIPTGLEQDAVMPLQGVTHYGVPINAVSVTSTGTPVVTCTSSGPHGLQTGNQIAAEGLSQPNANGLYSVAVTTATAFTWTVVDPVPAGSLLTSTSLIVTANAGIPLTYAQVPLAGG